MEAYKSRHKEPSKTDVGLMRLKFKIHYSHKMLANLWRLHWPGAKVRLYQDLERSANKKANKFNNAVVFGEL